MNADPCFLLKVYYTPDGVKRTVGTLTMCGYPTPEAAMAASGCEVWTKDMFGEGGEWRSDDGEWIIRRAMT